MVSKLVLLLGAAIATSAAAQMPPGDATTPPPPVPQTAAPTEPGQPDAAPREALAAAGYTDVRELQRSGDAWKGTALHKGKRVPVQVAADGRIMPPPM